MVKKYWLMKSEPANYSIDDLKKDKQTDMWGIRNYLARNYMRQMAIGDEVLFYHSSCEVPGVYGVAKVVKTAYPDKTQFDPKSKYFEKRATKEKPVWDLVDIAYVKTLKNPVPLTEIRKHKKLTGMQILAPHNRLSVTPVTASEFSEILKLGK
jgi:predicted RNA-binding protein with PUA-like domain